MTNQAPDAYWVEVGGRTPDADECGTGASLGPFVNEEVAKATALAIKGWTLGKIERLGLGAIDTYWKRAGGHLLAAQPEEVVRWAMIREQWVAERDINGLVTAWDPGDAEPVYDDFIPATDNA